MKFWEAMKLMSEGKKVRHVNAGTDCYYMFSKDPGHYNRIVDHEGIQSSLRFYHETEEWEVFKEPNKPVMRAQYMFQMNKCNLPVISNALYLDDEEFGLNNKQPFGPVFWFKRLEEIECES